jgi:hypothetical protein
LPVSKVTGFDRSGLPVIIAAVHVLDRCPREFFVGRVIQASDVDCVKFAAELSERAAFCERSDVAPAAKQEMEEWGRLRRGRVLVVGQGIGSLQQAKCIAFRESHPKPRLAAEPAIAAGRTSGQIEVAFKLDSAAVATAFVRLFHSKVSYGPTYNRPKKCWIS